MTKSERYNFIANLCAVRSIGVVSASAEDVQEETTLALIHNDNESILDEEVEGAFVSLDLIKSVDRVTERAEHSDELLFTPSEKKQIEEDKWANRRKFALMIVPPVKTIASMVCA